MHQNYYDQYEGITFCYLVIHLIRHINEIWQKEKYGHDLFYLLSCVYKTQDNTNAQTYKSYTNDDCLRSNQDLSYNE